MSALDLLPVTVETVEIPFSILDTDLYKLTMQNAVLQHFPNSKVIIRFTNRAPQMLFNRVCFDWVQNAINRLETLRLTDQERQALSTACPYFPDTYLDFLASIQLKPREQVELTFEPQDDTEWGLISCKISGLWRECILYEVPIMSILSESYFKFVDTDWNLNGVKENAKAQALKMLNPPSPTSPLVFSEFGTRRRRSFQVHDLVMQGLCEGMAEHKKSGKGGLFAGSSNVLMALRYGVKPIGTIAHEWIMGVAAMKGYEGVNGRAMDMWEQVYPAEASSPLHTMLTDTFTAQTFFKDFISDPARAQRWGGLRQDSGDAFEFVREAKEAWRKVEAAGGVNQDGKLPVAKGKKVVFSDGLNADDAIALQRGCDDIGMECSFGIGTFLTNDFREASNPSKKSKPLNIVIKLYEIEGRKCIKLSDDKGKHTGDVDEVNRVKTLLGV